jgi:hypothetical protein
VFLALPAVLRIRPSSREDARMGEIVNLRQVKKQRERAAAEQRAAENRARHGRTVEARKAERLEQERRQALLDGAKKDDA